MKFNCGPDAKTKARIREERLTNWHPFFTVLPRRIGPNECRWLEWIERKMTFSLFDYEWVSEYRAKQEPKP